MNRERLERGAELIRELIAREVKNVAEGDLNAGEDGFDLTRWGNPADEDEGCGTVACLGGWMTLALREAGLRNASDLDTNLENPWPKLVPEYRGLTGYDALGEFFELSHEQTLFIFSPGHPVTGRFQKNTLEAALKRLQEVLSGWGEDTAT